MFEHLKEWRALRVNRRQLKDSLLRLAEEAVAALQQAHARLILPERFFESTLASFEVLDNGLKCFQRLLERQFICLGFAHSSRCEKGHPRWLGGGPVRMWPGLPPPGL